MYMNYIACSRIHKEYYNKCTFQHHPEFKKACYTEW